MIICNSGSMGIQKDYEKWGVPKQVPPKIVPKQVLGGTHIGTKGGAQTGTHKRKKIKKLIQKKYILLAKRLGEKILERKPDYKAVLKQQKREWIDWADDIRLMVERDGRDLIKIEKIIDWCQQDKFWKNNILSTSKLRIQFDKLELAAKEEKNKPTW